MMTSYTIVSSGMRDARRAQERLGALKVLPLAVCINNPSNSQVAIRLHTPPWFCRDAEILVGRCGRDTGLEERLVRGEDGIFPGRTGMADCEEDVD